MSDPTATLAHHWAVAAFVLGVVALCLLMPGIASLLGGRAFGRSKNDPFESGVVPTGDSHLRFSAKFYLVAMLFVIFDIEALYLFAWAVSIRESGWAGFAEAAVFIAILLAGLVYLWRVGALDWAPRPKDAENATPRQPSNREVR